jgi:hypothetical protein
MGRHEKPGFPTRGINHGCVRRYAADFDTLDGHWGAFRWYFPSKNDAAIVALHGLSGNRLQVVPQRKILAEHGYGVLVFAMLGHGESDNGRFTLIEILGS